MSAKKWTVTAAVASTALAASLVAAGAFPGGVFSWPGAIFLNTAGVPTTALPDTTIFAGSNPVGDVESTAFGCQALMSNTDAPQANTAFGAATGSANIHGESNCYFGHGAGMSHIQGSFNAILGSAALGQAIFLADHNAFFGDGAGGHGYSYAYCVGIGGSAIFGVPAASYSEVTALGFESFYSLIDGATGGVALGFFSGHYETVGGKFYLNDRDRGDLATEKAESLMVGTFGADHTDQMLTVNAIHFILPYLPTSASGLPTGTLWNSSGAVHVA